MRDAEGVRRPASPSRSGEGEAAERLILSTSCAHHLGLEWRRLTTIEQRVWRSAPSLMTSTTARILRAGRVPKELTPGRRFCEMIGMRPPAGVYTHIIGVDIVRTGETSSSCSRNARTPSGFRTCWRTARRYAALPSCSSASGASTITVAGTRRPSGLIERPPPSQLSPASTIPPISGTFADQMVATSRGPGSARR